MNIFHRDIFNKKLSLLIYGESNTGKTSIVVNLIINYIGRENVGTIVSSNNFKLQELQNKVVGILDEFRYSSKNSGDFLKLLGGENLIVEKKYSKQHVSIDNIPIIIVSNNFIEDKDEKINEALLNRIYSVEFLNPITEEELGFYKNFNKHIKEEEIDIILYCNKILFKNLKGKKNNFCRKIGNKIKNKKFLERFILNENKKNSQQNG
jgi:phage/plasmid-associated DNA primase